MSYYDLLTHPLWLLRSVRLSFWGQKYCSFLKTALVAHYLLTLMDGHVRIVLVPFVSHMDKVNPRLLRPGGGG